MLERALIESIADRAVPSSFPQKVEAILPLGHMLSREGHEAVCILACQAVLWSELVLEVEIVPSAMIDGGIKALTAHGIPLA